MSRRLIVSAIQGALLSASFSVLAEDVPTVVVSATRSEQSTVTVPTTIKVISQQDIQNSAATSVMEILSGLGGLQISDFYSDGAYASVTMRGLDSTSNVLILVDGRRLNNVDMSSPQLNSVSVKDIERIEIIQGSSGALFGDQAVGGVVNIITKSAQKITTATVSTGSYNRSRLQLSTGDKITDNLSYRLSGDILSSDNYRDNSSVNDKYAFARLDYLTASGKYFAEYQLADTYHELPGSLYAAEIAQNRQQSYVDFAEDYSESSTNVARIGAQQGVGQNWSVEMELTSRDENLNIQQSYRGWQVTTPSAVDNKQLEFTPRLIGAIGIGHGDMTVTFGADLIDTQYDSEITSVSDDQEMRSIYAQFVVPVIENWSVTVGGRRSTVENDVVATYKTGKVKSNVTVGELGVSWQPIEAMKLFARVDQNYRFAKVDEFTYTSPGDELKPQTGTSKEVGMQWNRAGHTASITAYQLSLKDEIAFDPSAPEPVGSFWGPGANVNFDPTTHEGFIVDAYYPFSNAWSLATNFSYTDATFDSGVYKDKQIPGISPRVLTLAPEFNNGKGLVSRFEFVYNDKAYVDGDADNSKLKKDSYSIVNVSTTVSQDSWHASLRINNLMNRIYNEYENSWGAITPANEINFWLSLGVDIK